MLHARPPVPDGAMPNETYRTYPGNVTTDDKRSTRWIEAKGVDVGAAHERRRDLRRGDLGPAARPRGCSSCSDLRDH
jgi:hypothetical protein